MNSWSPSCQLICRVYTADGEKKIENYNTYGSSLVLSDDKLSATCEYFSITCLNEKPTYQVSYKGESITLEFEFETVDRGFEKGKIPFMDDADSGYVLAQLVPKANIRHANFSLEGKVIELDHAMGCFVHAVQNQPQQAARWNFVDFQSEKDALMMFQFEIPGESGVVTQSQGALILDNQLTAICFDNHSTFKSSEVDDFSGYHIPKAITHVWRGTTMANEPVQVTMHLELTRLLDKIDVLGELPFLVRKFVQTFITAPFVYQWFQSNVSVQVELNGVTKVIQGNVFHENVFMLELEH